VANEPVSHDIEAILPWLADPAIPQMLGRATIDPGTGYQGRVWGERHVEAFANGRGDASDVREALAPLMPQAGEDRSTISNVFGNVSRIASS
jgi:hypothetical protein